GRTTPPEHGFGTRQKQHRVPNEHQGQKNTECQSLYLFEARNVVHPLLTFNANIQRRLKAVRWRPAGAGTNWNNLLGIFSALRFNFLL
ncbi:hypothetical protein, partial [Marinobacter halodurans]|uniref:hypothetical protein n=1 Tax=Marinobacter halodurans TaxID=2528979 RepID=UPI001A955203